MPIPACKKNLIRLTPDKAKRFLKLNTYIGQRDPSPANITKLADKLRNGLFHVGNVATATNGQAKYLVNGQHLCNAVVQSGISCDALSQEFRVKNKQELAVVYSQFDDHMARTPGAVAYFVARCAGLSDAVPQGCVRLAAAAQNLLEQDFKAGNRPRYSKFERAERVGHMVKEIEWLAKVAYPRRDQAMKNSAHLRRAPVIAALLASYAKNKSHATEFWTDVRDGAGLDEENPALLCREFLLRIPRIRKGLNPRVESGPYIRSVEVYSRCVLYWNAWRTEEAVMRYKADEIPEVQ